jgi:hypothetical protein
VQAGQVLGEVESLELEKLQLDLLDARNQMRLSGQVLRDLERGLETGSVAEQDVLEARLGHRQNEIALEVARARWLSLGLPADQLGALLDAGRPTTRTLPVRAPVSGTVIHTDLSVGKVVGLRAPVRDRGPVHRLGADRRPRQGLSRVEVGRRSSAADVPAGGLPGGRARQGLHLDRRRTWRTCGPTSPTLPGRRPQLLPAWPARPGCSAPARPVTAVPVEALVRAGAEHFVLVEQAGAEGGSQYVRKNVVPGRRTQDWVEIRTAEVFPGDRVVVRGHHELAGFLIQGVLRPSPEASRAMGLAVEPFAAHVVERVVELDGAVDVPPDCRAAARVAVRQAILRLAVDRGNRSRPATSSLRCSAWSADS